MHMSDIDVHVFRDTDIDSFRDRDTINRVTKAISVSLPNKRFNLVSRALFAYKHTDSERNRRYYIKEMLENFHVDQLGKCFLVIVTIDAAADVMEANSLMCHIKELVAALANALKLSLMTEIELYSHVSDEEFEIIRLSKRERRREILKLIKTKLVEDTFATGGVCGKCLFWRFASAITWGNFFIHGKNTAHLIDSGSWFPTLGMNLTDVIFPHIVHGFRGIDLPVATYHVGERDVESFPRDDDRDKTLRRLLQNPPWQIISLTDSGKKEYGGLVFDVVKYLAKKMNFTYSVLSPASNRTIKFTRNESETEVTYSFLTAKPGQLTRALLFAAPFAKETWACLAASIIIMGPSLYLIHKYSPSNAKMSGLNSSWRCVWYIYGALLQQGGVYLPHSDSARLLVGIWWLVVMVVVATYSGSLVAFLTFPNMDSAILTVNALLANKNRLTWGFPNGSYLEEYLKNAEEEKYHILLKRAIIHNATQEPEIIKKVKAGKHALIDWRSTLRLHRMHESGLMNKWITEQIPTKDKCSDISATQSVNERKVNVTDMQGIFFVLFMAVSSAFAYRYDPWYRADTQRPVDVITDVVNDLGVRILQQYSAHGNVAFSPTGIAFVLAALYEGSAGRGCQQIAEVIGLPPRDVTRIGLRDIHRRLRSYLNADGFLGGLTLSKENTRLRPEYEDILRFYGFDLSSIEQEANVTVNTEDSSATTPELPTSTAGSTIPMEAPIDTRNEPDTTTTTLSITTPPSESTTATRQSVTMDVIDVQSSTVASPESAVPSTTSSTSAGSLPAVTSGESIQPTSTTIVVDSQTNPITVLATDQASSTTVAVEDAETETVANTIVLNSTENVEEANSNAPDGTSNANIQAPQGIDTTTAADAPNDEMRKTNVSTTIVADATSVNNTSVTDANTVTPNSLIPATSTPLTGATNYLTTPSPVIETTTDNSVISQSRMTSMSAEVSPTGNTPEIITPTRDLAMTPIIDVDHDDANTESSATISSVQAINTTMTSNDSMIADSMDNQANGNPVSTNRKKKRSEPDLKVVMNDGTVRDESTNRRSPNLRERRERSPRGYFSSYP
ncbi:glutamate receptor delta-2 subunit, partial [Lasius niger]